MSEDTATNWAKRDRPGCVTAYAVLLWIAGGLYVIGAVCVGLSGFGLTEGSLGIFEICLGLLFVLLAAVPIATGLGIWQMRKWGWALVIVIQSLGIILSLVQLVVFTLAGPGDNLSLYAGTIVGLAVSSYIVYWFVTHREMFNGATTYSTAIGIDGAPVPGPVEKKGTDTATTLAILGGLALVLVLVCLVVIAILALLGPQIGNVFSQITYSLEAGA